MEASNQSLKLNLGCGQFPKEGYLNVDKYGEPEFRFDLETFPWPWADNSVEHIILHHVLEHLGAATDIYLKIIGELYRVCKVGALIDITVPHPRHEDFIGDPTHVRAITPYSFRLFSKAFNKVSTASPLGSLLNVDFELVNVDMKK